MHRTQFYCLLRFLILALLGVSGFSRAETPQFFLEEYRQEAKAQNPGFKGFSPAAGESFYRNKHGGDWSCASCHTDNPAAIGKHVVTGKPINPCRPMPTRNVLATRQRSTNGSNATAMMCSNVSALLKKKATF